MVGIICGLVFGCAIRTIIEIIKLYKQEENNNDNKRT